MIPTVIIGVGNEFRGDDGVGRVAARRLAKLAPSHVTVCESQGEALTLMDLWAEAARVILIDAAAPEGSPGDVRRFDASKRALPSEYFHASTHAFSVADAIEMGRTLGQLPPAVIVYGIEGENFEQGAELTPAVQQGCDEVLRRILAELDHGLSHG